jgi:hypothetical protein
MNFDFVFLGQSVLKYQVPLDIFHSINHIYESNFHNLHPANKQLEIMNYTLILFG